MNKEKEIQKAKKILKEAGYIDTGWHKDDIEFYAKNEMHIEITKEQVDQVAIYIERKHDCNNGLNWDFIKHCIETVLEPET